MKQILPITTAAFLSFAVITSAVAQSTFADGLTGLSQANNEPIAIEADALEVRDAQKQAVFTGNVIVTQGDMILETHLLRVFYTGSAQGEEGNQDIQRLEAEGAVVLTSGTQRATGNSGVYDAKTDIVTLSGNVVLSDGDSVINGRELIVNLVTGTSEVIGDGSDGRVRGLFNPDKK